MDDGSAVVRREPGWWFSGSIVGLVAAFAGAFAARPNGHAGVLFSLTTLVAPPLGTGGPAEVEGAGGFRGRGAAYELDGQHQKHGAGYLLLLSRDTESFRARQPPHPRNAVRNGRQGR
jgi:hypothetical protein